MPLSFFDFFGQVRVNPALFGTVLLILAVLLVNGWTDAPNAIAGAVVTENIFAIPGVGVLLINAVKARDVPIVMGTVIFVTIIVGIINLAVDIICALIDPRIDFAS